MSERGSRPKGNSLNPTKKTKVITIKKPWDDRFWISQRQLDESYFEKLRKFYAGRGGKYEKDPRNRNIEKIPDASLTKDKSKVLDKSLESRQGPPVSITTEALNEVKSKIEHEWESHNIPVYFREIFRKSVFGLSRHKAVAIISREIEDLKKKRSFVQTAIDAVRAREEGIKNIKEMLEYFTKSQDWEKSSELCEEIIEILNAHRILTLNTVESIIKWKEQLVYALILNKTDSIGKHKSINFMWDDQNYVVKMKNDLDFLKGSDFSKVLSFSEFYDPMLITPSKPIERKNIKPLEYQRYLNIPPMLGKRVKLAEQYILDEGREDDDLNKSQAVLPQPRTTKRIDEKAAKKILEEIVEGVCENELKPIAQKFYEEQKKNISAAAAKKLEKKLVKETAFSLAKEVALQAYSEACEGPIRKHVDGILAKYIEEEIERTVKVMAKEEIKNSKTSAKEAIINERKHNKDKEKTEKKRKEEQAALEKKLAKEKEENEAKRRAEEALRKQMEEENSKLAKMILEWVLKDLHVDIELLVSYIYKSEIDNKSISKTKSLQNTQISEEVQRKLIDELIDSMDLNGLSESVLTESIEAKRISDQKAAELDKNRMIKAQGLQNPQLSLEIHQNLIEDLITSTDLKLLAESALTEAVEAKRLFDSHQSELASSTSSKAQALQMIQISEQLQRIFIDEIIDSIDLHSLSESILSEAIEIKKRNIHSKMERSRLEARERSLINDKLSEQIYLSLFEELLGKMKLDKITEKMMEQIVKFRNSISLAVDTSLMRNITVDPDDYAVDEFTPGEHSPAHYEVSEEEKLDGEASLSPRKHEENPHEFSSTGEFRKLDNLQWVPIHVSEANIEDTFAEYFSSLHELLAFVSPTVPQLLLEAYRGIDPCWYWALNHRKIVGALVYSLDFQSSTRIITVHHMSAVDFSLLDQLINAATFFLFEEDACEEIRVNLLFPMGKEIPKEVKKVFTGLKFKWKASADSRIPKCDMNVMGRTRESMQVRPGQRTGENMTFALRSACLVEPSDVGVALNNNTAAEMVQLGNRQCQISALINLFGKLDKSGIQLGNNSATRMQIEISDILEIVNSTVSFNFPNISCLVTENPKEAGEFLKSYGFDDFSTMQKSSISVLDVSFKFISCTNFTHMVNKAQFRYLRFRSPEILVGNDHNVYSIPTSVPHIKAVFIEYEGIKQEVISDMRRDRTDLFYKVENLLKSTSYTSSEEMQYFSIPAFKKKINWIIPWIQGYEIPPQRGESSSQFVKKCFETVKINVEAPLPAKGILNLENTKGKVFSGDFVFCLTHTGLDRVIDMPLFVCLVEQDDWIHS